MDNQDMNIINEDNYLTGRGYLIVRATTARSAVPVPNATVNIRGSSAESSHILYSLKTDVNGLSGKIPLPAPLKSSAEHERSTRPYEQYNIEVFAEGYTPQNYLNVPIFDGITSYQTADLVPLPASLRNDSLIRADIYESTTPDL